MDGNQRVDWSSGGGALLLSSGAVRVNKRGIRLLPEKVLDGLPWSKFSCNHSAWAACEASFGRIFPVHAPSISDIILPAGLRLECARQVCVCMYFVL
jgi:hypothetical protein